MKKFEEKSTVLLFENLDSNKIYNLQSNSLLLKNQICSSNYNLALELMAMNLGSFGVIFRYLNENNYFLFEVILGENETFFLMKKNEWNKFQTLYKKNSNINLLNKWLDFSLTFNESSIEVSQKFSKSLKNV